MISTIRKTLFSFLAAIILSAPALAQVIGTAPQIVDVKILFCQCGSPVPNNEWLNPLGGFNEDSTIQPWQDWYYGTAANATTVKQMMVGGWTLYQVIPRGGSSAVDHFYIVFVKYAPPALPAATPPPDPAPTDPPPDPAPARVPAVKR